MVYQILALFIWSSAFVAAKYTFTMMDTILMIQVRLFMAAIIVMPLFFRRWKGVSKPMRKQLWWLGFFNYTATFLLQFIGLKYTSAASATTMIGLEPLCVIFIGHFFFQDRAKWYHWLCGAFAFLGVAILILGGHGNEGASEISLLGCSLVVAASIVFACCLRWTKKVDAKISGILTALEPIFGVFLAVLLLNEEVSLVSALGIIIIVASALGVSLLPKWLHKEIN